MSKTQAFIRNIRTRTKADPKKSDLTFYKQEPSKYAKDIFGLLFWKKQEEIVQSVLKNPITVVDSGHGTGKSKTAATLVNFWYDVHDSMLCITTAPSWNSVKGIIWREIRAMRSVLAMKGVLTETSLKDRTGKKEAVGISTNDSVNMQGKHHPNLLQIVDEGPGVPNDIYEAMLANATGSQNRLLTIGNPIGEHTRHYILRERSDANVIRISCLEHPNVVHQEEIIPGAVTYGWVDQSVKEWCEKIEDVLENAPNDINRHFYWDGFLWKPSAIAESKILGLTPKNADDVVIPFSVIQQAHARRDDAFMPEAATVQVGIDGAYTGQDETVMYFNHSGWVEEPVVWQGYDTIQSANRIIRELLDKKSKYRWIKRYKILIDQGGVVGLVDQLRKIIREDRLSWIHLVPVYFGSAATDSSTYANLRAELYFTARNILRDSKASLPKRDPKLDYELGVTRYTQQKGNRIQLESKEAIKKRIGRSPDRADALVLALYNGNLEGGDWIPSLNTTILALKSMLPGNRRK